MYVILNEMSATICSVLCLFSVSRTCESEEIYVSEADAFSVYPSRSSFQPGSSVDQFFVLNHRIGSQLVTYSGPFKSVVNLEALLPTDINGMADTSEVVCLEQQANVSAHLVHKSIPDTKPQLQVFIHSDAELTNAHCIQAYVLLKGGTLISNSCMLWKRDGRVSGSSSVTCLINIILPFELWSSRSAKVYFDIQPSVLCTSGQRKMARTNLDGQGSTFLPVGKVRLIFDDRHKEKDISEDERFVVSLPQDPVDVGDHFDVTLKLHPGIVIKDGSVRYVASLALLYGANNNIYCRTGFDSDSLTVVKIVTKNHHYHSIMV